MTEKIVSQENLLWFHKWLKLWHDNRYKWNTFLSYYMGNWYWHEWWTPRIPIPDDPVGIPVDPCDLCKDNEECVNWECYNPDEEQWECPCTAPLICVDWHCIPADGLKDPTPIEERNNIDTVQSSCWFQDYETIYKIDINNWWQELQNWFVTWADNNSWVRYYFNPLKYHEVTIEWRLNAINNDNYIEYWFWSTDASTATQWECHEIAIAVLLNWINNWQDRVRVTLKSNWDFTVRISRYIKPGWAYDWEVFKSWNVNWVWDASPLWDLDYELPVWMVIWVHWWAYITSSSTKNTYGTVSTTRPWTSDETTIIHDWTNGTMTFQHPSSWREVTIMDKNLWATSYYHRWDAQSDETKWTMYQWWNNYWFAPSWNLPKTSNTKVDTTWYSPSTYTNDTYITWYTEWMDPVNKDLWWEITWTETAKRWPCPKWWHIPSLAEWMDLRYILYVRYNVDRGASYWDNSFPVWWKYRDVDWWLSWLNENAYYRASDLNWNSSCYVNISWLNWAVTNSYGSLWYAMFIRPFKNVTNS